MFIENEKHQKIFRFKMEKNMINTNTSIVDCKTNKWILERGDLKTETVINVWLSYRFVLGQLAWYWWKRAIFVLSERERGRHHEVYISHAHLLFRSQARTSPSIMDKITVILYSLENRLADTFGTAMLIGERKLWKNVTLLNYFCHEARER